MLDAETKRRIDTARDILVGKLPDPKSQVEQITIALVYKFMDDMDKESESLGGKPTFFKGEYAKYSWSNIFDPKLGGHELIALYGDAITQMNQIKTIPQLFRDIFKNAYLPYRDPETLKMFLKTINEFHYDHSEKLGDAFEYLLSIMGSQGDAGQFRTPRHIIDFIVSVVEPKKNETVLDPACGTAGFLISAYKQIVRENTKDNKNMLTPDEKKRLVNNFIGYDISPDMVRLSLVNLYLHGFKNPKIYEYDTLSSEDRWNEMYDVIMANPPFMTPKGGITPHKKFSVQANRSEVLFVDYIAEHLNPTGRAGIIVPEGIIFQSSNAYQALRKMLIDNYLYAVVSLPAGVFNPYSGVKTSILLLDKNLTKKTKNILFIKVENDGFGLGAQRREIEQNDLTIAYKILQKYKQSISKGSDYKLTDEEKKFAHIVSKQKISDSDDYNLSGDRYKEVVVYKNAKWLVIKLEELEKEEKIEFLRGQGISKQDIIENGRNKCIHYGEIYTLYQSIIKEVISKTNSAGKVLSIKGDVLVPSTTTADAMGIAVARSLNEDGIILGSDINIIRTENKYILSDYLTYLICNFPLKNQLATYAKGANILHLSNNDLRQLEIPLPPLEIQQQIVAEIGSYQKIIDGAKQIVDNYKPTIKIDPTWQLVELGKCIEILTDYTANGSFASLKANVIYKNTQDYAILVRLTDLRVNFQNENIVYVPKSSYDFLKKSSLSGGEFLIANVGANIGDVYLMPQISQPATLGPNMYLVKFNNKLSTAFAYILALTEGVKKQILTMSVSAAQPKINKDQFRSVKILLPPIDVQQQIVAQIEEEQKLVDSNKKLIELFEKKIQDKISEIWEGKE
jgi:type I restriction enzyme M protein